MRLVLWLKTWIEYTAFMAVRRIALFLSYERAHAIGRVLGGAVFRFTSIRKAVTLDNLRRAFPEKADGEIRLIAHGAFQNYGSAILEMLWYSGASDSDLRRVIRFKSLELPNSVRARGKGIILLSAHFGSWELIIPGINVGMGWPMLTIVQRQRNKKIDAIIDRQRQMHGTTTVPMNLAIKEVLKTLRAGNVMMLLGDQSGSRESLYIPFFGRPAATHRGTASFALKTGTPVVMMLLCRGADGLVDVDFEEVKTADLVGASEENIVELTRRHVAMLERKIRERPDHWLWMHKRWKHTTEP